VSRRRARLKTLLVYTCDTWNGKSAGIRILITTVRAHAHVYIYIYIYLHYKSPGIAQEICSSTIIYKIIILKSLGFFLKIVLLLYCPHKSPTLSNYKSFWDFDILIFKLWNMIQIPGLLKAILLCSGIFKNILFFIFYSALTFAIISYNLSGDYNNLLGNNISKMTKDA
jgi:hypothetical protein